MGKSSLVNAGFLPGILQEGFLPERVRVRPEQGAEFQAERIPLGDADQPPYLPSRFISPSLIESSVAVSVERFTGILSAPHSAGAPLLVFDQFEELITLFDETPDSPKNIKRPRSPKPRSSALWLGYCRIPPFRLSVFLFFVRITISSSGNSSIAYQGFVSKGCIWSLYRRQDSRR